MELYILISLYNYFIVDDIKYVFLNKNNQTIQGGKKNFKGGQITESITEKYYFSKEDKLRLYFDKRKSANF
jgi:hypothetical protein